MTTPQSTPIPPLHPNSASKKNANVAAAAAAVHTPSGPASAPRSVPSPAAVRATGKTPATGGGGGGGGGGGMKMGGTPMGLSLSSLGMSPSGFTPGGQMTMMGGLPIAGFTPTSSMTGGSMMMMPSMSDLGLSSKRGGGGDGEYERKRKMRRVLRRIGGRSAGVGEEGICRVSRRVGLANDVDAEGEEARREREGERGISIAGRDVLIDVEMKGNRARGVVVAGMGGVEQGEMERAGKVLEGLLVEGEGDLEGFGRELRRIAALDRVGERGVSAFEAVSGVERCLERLHRKECEGEDEDKVLKRKSGRPWMHSRGRIGLGVDYWTTSPPTPPKDDNAMDLDHYHQQGEEKEDPSDFLTLHITAETCPAGIYPPLRISSHWLPEDLSTPKPDEEDTTSTAAISDFQIPWQDPPPTYTTPSSEDEPSGPETQQQSKLPDIRFLARLEPPLIVPYQTASQILAEMGGEGVQGMVTFREWHLMLASEGSNSSSNGLVGKDNTPADVTTQDANLRANGLHGCAVVLQGRDGEEVKHIYSLDVTKAEWGYRLMELPFAHPRQVVGLLPILRQWGVFGEMVKSLLLKDSTSTLSSKGEEDAIKREGGDDDDDLLNSLLTPPPSEEGEADNGDGNVRVQIEISTTPLPTLSISLPTMKGQGKGKGQKGGMGKVVFSVGRNADIRIELIEGLREDGGGDDDDDDDGAMEEEEGGLRERLAKGLEICGGEVGVWIEWIRSGGWRKGKDNGKGKEQEKGK